MVDCFKSGLKKPTDNSLLNNRQTTKVKMRSNSGEKRDALKSAIPKMLPIERNDNPQKCPSNFNLLLSCKIILNVNDKQNIY